MIEKTIELEKKYGKILGLRSDAERLFNELNEHNADKIIMDFDKIEFMTRSFAQEYLSQKLKSEYKIEDINTGEDVWRMFDLVKRDNVNLKRAKEN